MAIIKSQTFSAENTFSDPFHLAGDGAGWPRRALINISGGSTVTVRRMNGETVLSSLTLTKSSAMEVPVQGDYVVGVATGDYVDAITITVEQ